MKRWIISAIISVSTFSLVILLVLFKPGILVGIFAGIVALLVIAVMTMTLHDCWSDIFGGKRD